MIRRIILRRLSDPALEKLYPKIAVMPQLERRCFLFGDVNRRCIVAEYATSGTCKIFVRGRFKDLQTLAIDELPQME